MAKMLALVMADPVDSGAICTCSVASVRSLSKNNALVHFVIYKAVVLKLVKHQRDRVNYSPSLAAVARDKATTGAVTALNIRRPRETS